MSLKNDTWKTLTNIHKNVTNKDEKHHSNQTTVRRTESGEAIGNPSFLYIISKPRRPLNLVQ